jgi:3',5'-cyclic AMP phosphodiesterase CpdA
LICDPKGKELSDNNFTKSKSSCNSILQFTDLHYYNNGSKADAEGVKLIGTLSERVKPDLVVLTGDIIDGRYCGDYKCFRNVIAPLIDLQIPWTYIPGNHDDETEAFTRRDLLNVYSYPYCASRNANSFTHSLMVGPMQLFMIDSHGYTNSTSISEFSYDYIKEEQINWYSNTTSKAELGLAFFHIPLVEYKLSKVLVGTKGEEPCTPQHNSGFFGAIQKKKDVHAMFVGHDHWNDF